jgi:hypothetical protein
MNAIGDMSNRHIVLRPPIKKRFKTLADLSMYSVYR